MSMSPSSGKASMKSSLRPRMLRKWTLKILPRSPNQRITSKISRPGSSSISPTVPWQKLRPCQGLSRMLDELLQPLDGAQDPRDAPIAGRRVGIVRVAGEPDLVLLGHRHHALEEIVDALPVGVGIEQAGETGRRILGRLVPAERRIERAAAAALLGRAGDADDVEVVLGGRDARQGEVADELADAVDLPVAVRPGQQNVRALALLDRPAAERQLDHVEAETEASELLLVTLEGLAASSRAGCPGDRRRHAPRRAAPRPRSRCRPAPAFACPDAPP